MGIRVSSFLSLCLKCSFDVRRVDVKSNFMKMGNRNVHGTTDTLCGSCIPHVNPSI